jgi:hypothetical protein
MPYFVFLYYEDNICIYYKKDWLQTTVIGLTVCKPLTASEETSVTLTITDTSYGHNRLWFSVCSSL